MTNRRAFLRTVGSAGALAGLTGAGGCVPDVPGRFGGGTGARGGLEPLTRPRLRPWASDMVWVDAPGDELPVTYVSMALRQVFVDFEYRDRATWLLHAHISVSTALWRIPLPGDPPGEPIMPGDAQREFEELPMRAWDPSMPPAMDDIRIVRGRAARRSLDFQCVPLVGGATGSASGSAEESWISGGPMELLVSDRSEVESVREDFRVLGTGQRWPERRCAGSGEVVQLVGWAGA